VNSDGYQLRVIDGPTVGRLLPPPAAASAMAEALRRFSAGEALQPLRSKVPSGINDGQLLVMPAGDTTGNLAVKVIGLFPANSAKGIAPINGLVLLFDPDTGRACAAIDGAALTEIRTAAVSAVATTLLARPDATRLTVIGTGAQACAHLAALATVRSWSDCRVASRTPARAAAVAEWASSLGLPTIAVDSVDDAVRGADVICTTTSSSTPVLASDSVASHGVHLNAIGTHTTTARELPGELVGRATPFVESRGAARHEAGDLCQAVADGFLDPDTPWTELGEVIAGRHPGRTSADQTTLFKSVGMAAEDLAAALAVYQRAEEHDAGTVIPMPTGNALPHAAHAAASPVPHAIER
jgi:ornithine cyclodeaminase/alanine dehydrogenase-like protein (mu-crystallin family)